MKTTYLKFIVLAFLLLGNMRVQAEDFSEAVRGGVNLKFSTLPVSEGKAPAVKITGLAANSADVIPTLYIPRSVNHEGVTYAITAISSEAFAGDRKIKNVVFSDSEIEVGFRAFRDTGVETVMTSETAVVSFDNGCFSNCPGLKEIYFGAGVRNIGNGIVQECYNLTSLGISPENPVYSTDGTAVFDKEQTKLLFIIDSYDGDYRIPSTVTVLPHQDGWAYGKKLNSLTIPQSVESIAYNVFLSGNIVIENHDVSSITLGHQAFLSPFSIKVPSEAVDSYKAAWPEYASVITDGSYVMAVTTDEPLSTKKTVMIPVSLSNSGSVIGFQCDIHLPYGASIATDNNGKYAVKLSDRATKSHTLTAGSVSDGSHISGTSSQVTRLVCVSLTNAVFKGNDGILLYIPVTLSSIGESDRYHAPVIIDNIHLSEPGNTRIDLPVAGKYLCEIDYTPGDADDDGTVSVVDVTSTISHMIGQTPERFLLTAVDFDNDGNIMINDVTTLIDMVLNNDDDPFGFSAPAMRSESTDPEAAYSMTVANLSAKKDSGAEISVSIDNEAAILGFQCDITLPEGVTIDPAEDGDGYECVLNESRCSDHIVATRSVATKENTVRILVFSLSNTPIDGNSGVVFSCPVTVNAPEGTYPVTLSRIILSGDGNTRIDLPDYSGELTVSGDATGMETIESDSDLQNIRVYDLQGRPAAKTTRGIIVTEKGKFLVR